MSLKIPLSLPVLPTPDEIQELKERVGSLRDLLRDQMVRKKVRCPHPDHDDAHPSCTVGDRDWFCHGCKRSGDVLDWLQLTEGLNLRQAAEKLGWTPNPSRSRSSSRSSRPTVKLKTRTPSTTSSSRSAAWQDPVWQSAVNRLVEDAVGMLWSPAGLPILDWLRARGLRDDTLRQWRVGAVLSTWSSDPIEVLGLDEHGRRRRIWCPRGVVWPWGYACEQTNKQANGLRWVGANCRRLAERPGDLVLDREGQPIRDKNHAVAGSIRGYMFPWSPVRPGVPTLVVEGEPDALLAWQELADAVNVVTVGGAGTNPQPDVLTAMAMSPVWLIGLDADNAGRSGSWSWHKLAPHKTRRVLLPDGCDWTDCYRQGIDLRALIDPILDPSKLDTTNQATRTAQDATPTGGSIETASPLENRSETILGPPAGIEVEDTPVEVPADDQGPTIFSVYHRWGCVISADGRECTCGALMGDAWEPPADDQADAVEDPLLVRFRQDLDRLFSLTPRRQADGSLVYVDPVCGDLDLDKSVDWREHLATVEEIRRRAGIISTEIKTRAS
jgi:predicted Fe-S protein YdhL (DUF1289 family)